MRNIDDLNTRGDTISPLFDYIRHFALEYRNIANSNLIVNLSTNRHPMTEI